MKKFLNIPKPCCADNLEEWDCYCTFGCDSCNLHWRCKKCGGTYASGPDWVRSQLKHFGILDSWISVFKVQLSMATTENCDQILVYNKKRTICYQESATSEHGRRLRALFPKKPTKYPDHYKVFVLAAYNKERDIIIPYSYAGSCYRW